MKANAEDIESFVFAAAPAFASMYTFTVKLADLSVALSDYKRWAGQATSEGYGGEFLRKWQ